MGGCKFGAAIHDSKSSKVQGCCDVLAQLGVESAHIDSPFPVAAVNAKYNAALFGEFQNVRFVEPMARNVKIPVLSRRLPALEAIQVTRCKECVQITRVY